jgi:alanine-glyoxylate transaminase/serine-glyoxylate transaminase/serine-pyruvate transaminase
MTAIAATIQDESTHPYRELFGPGPSKVSTRVLQATARPTLGHMDPEFIDLMDDTRRLLRYAFQTDYDFTFPLSGPGSAGMEACLVNLLEPEDTAVICRNGVFGGRMAEIARRTGAKVTVVDVPWGDPVQPVDVEQALDANPGCKVLAFVHAETSTGVLSDARELAEIARRHGSLTVVDAVTSLGGVPLEVDAWGLDAVYSGSQKCLSSPPGLSPVTVSPRALDAVRRRRTPVQSWFLDFSSLVDYWSGSKRAYHHTAPVNSIYGLHESLTMLQEEGLETAWARHRESHEALAAGLRELGLELLVDRAHRLPQLNVVPVPADIDDAALRTALLRDHRIEIGGGLGELAGKVWRIGLMGYGARTESAKLIVDALATVLAEQRGNRPSVSNG